ncbi:T9SS type A sorting domain-containing protein [Aquimarina sp. TRL1]|uniref:reprolysin-like metallopeptidase n=1 Tax=Aquimarina sp. (strain TRL1) TaxID=2736252 RepID=UPI00158F609F|nr:zinc-dependent metalloprotease family protein [Aquimarina sp. TRL1]QKX06841.1 T9SS type A sorting domain-containing protein [Aquimarina sp. TRL1]
MKKQLSWLLCLCCIGIGYSQTNNYWKKTTVKSQTSIITTKRNLPNKTVFGLDIEGLKKVLKGSPSREKSAGKSNVIVQFPNANGDMESFKIFEAPVMHPDLAAKYPSIKSYAGQGIDDPTAIIRFSIAPSGLQSMKLSASEGSVFIEPYTTDGSYTIYKRSEKTATESKLRCLVEEKTSHKNFSGTTKRNADDGILRTFRLAVSTNGEYTQFHGGTKAGAMAAINATMTRVNGVYENDFGITMVLIANNDDVIYTNASTDPYSNGSFNSQLQSTLTSVIGEANYDVGHLFAKAGDNGNAGCIGCVCVNNRKGSAFTSRGTPEGDAFDIDYVAHELGHQFGANHTFTIRNEGTNAHYEPGSGSTIMGYAGITGATDVQQNSDPYFHFFSIQQVTNYVKSTNCQTNTNTGNAVPTVNAGADYTIPKGTPFVLTGQANDTDGDTLTYCWEQADENDASSTYPSATGTSGVTFRSYNPTTDNKRYFPRLETIKTGATSWQWEAVPTVARTLNFRLTVRDNKAGGAANNSDDMRVTVNGTAGPFVVNAPNTNVSWQAGTSQNVTWDVAGTTGNGVNAATVDILLSTDGGDTYPISLASGVTNDGSHSITVPNQPGTQNRIMVKGTAHIFFDISNANFTITGSTGGDTQAPTVPGNLTASNATQTTIDLSWDASTDNVGVTGYEIYQGNTLIETVTGTSYTATGLSPDTSYSFKIKAKDAAGNTSGFSNTATLSTLPGNTGTCDGGVSSFPYNEGFENTIGAWTQNTDDNRNWTVDANGTPSNNTGPASAAQGTYYVYIEASGNGTGYPNKRAILTSPCFDLSAATQATFTFQYHMYGASSMGSLAIEASSDNGASWTSVWSKSGNQGNSWQSATIDLSSYTGGALQLRLNGVTGTTWRSDIAVDDVKLSTGTITNPCTDVNLSIKLDNYPEETSWEILNSNNQVVASGGTYGSQPDGSTVTETACLEPGSYTFKILDSYGDGICCSYGNGSYSLTSGSTTLASGGSFGASESTSFTISSTARGISIDDFKTTEAPKISILPNPSASHSMLSVITPYKNVNYEIRDLLGRKVDSGVVLEKSIQLKSLKSGYYIVKLNVNNKISNHRLIIQNN